MSRRPRWAAAASALALLAAYGATSFTHAQAASSQSVTDPTGDANNLVDDNGGTTAVPNEPRADILSATATYNAGSVVLSARTAQPVNVASDPAWGESDVTWFIDTNGDKKFDYSVEYGADSGNLYADIYNAAGTIVCAGGAVPSIGQDSSYIVTVQSKCFGNPAAFNWGGRTEWAQAGKNVMDRFPDGDGNYFGPVTVPGSTTPPTTPTTRPGSNPGPVPTTTTTVPFRPIVTTPVESNQGFWLLGRDGGIFSFGTAGYYGSIGNIPLQKQVVAMAAKPDSTGYWFVDSGGGIYAYKAPFWGSMGNVRLNKPIVGMAATPSGQGYWMVASDGGIFAFGDAKFFGSTGAINLNKPIVGMATTPTGRGYWLVASDGGIFAFGDAPFYGSTGSITLNQPINGMAASPTGRGYWFVASDGGIFSFGDAGFFGSGANGNPVPVVGMAATKSGMGYRVVRADGSVLAFGSAGNGGGLTGTLASPIVGITTAF